MNDVVSHVRGRVGRRVVDTRLGEYSDNRRGPEGDARARREGLGLDVKSGDGRHGLIEDCRDVGLTDRAGVKGGDEWMGVVRIVGGRVHFVAMIEPHSYSLLFLSARAAQRDRDPHTGLQQLTEQDRDLVGIAARLCRERRSTIRSRHEKRRAG
jgi:hypothetical protein